MNISQTTLTLAVVVALSFVSVICLKLYNLYDKKISSIEIQKSTEAAGILNKAIIEMSLERSVMQVTLNLNTPIKSEFKALLDGQRSKSDDGFDEVLEMVKTDKTFRRGDDFIKQFNALKAKVDDIRQRADQSLAVDAFQRNSNEVDQLPRQMKDTIISMSLLPIKLRAEESELSTLMSVLSEVQKAAWENLVGAREHIWQSQPQQDDHFHQKPNWK